MVGSSGIYEPFYPNRESEALGQEGCKMANVFHKVSQREAAQSEPRGFNVASVAWSIGMRTHKTCFY